MLLRLSHIQAKKKKKYTFDHLKIQNKIIVFHRKENDRITSNVSQINSEHKVWKLVGIEGKTDAVLLIKRSTKFFLFFLTFQPELGKTNALHPSVNNISL